MLPPEKMNQTKTIKLLQTQTHPYLCQKTIWGIVMPCQDKWRDGVVVLKLWIVVKVRLEKLGLLPLNIKRLDCWKDAELLGIFHFPCDCCFLQGGKFSARGIGDANLPELWNCTRGKAHGAAHYCHVPCWFREIRVAAWEDAIHLCRFTATFCRTHLFRSDACTVSFTKCGTTFHFCFWPLVRGPLWTLLPLLLLCLQQIVVAAGASAKEVFEDTWRNLLQVYLAWTQCLVGRV